MPDWDPEDIKAAVRKKGVTLADVARSAGVRANALRLALTLPREEAEGLIAGVLDVHPQVIWPSRYHPDGTRKRPQPVDNYRAAARFGKPDRLAVLMRKPHRASQRGTVARG